MLGTVLEEECSQLEPESQEELNRDPPGGDRLV